MTDTTHPVAPWLTPPRRAWLYRCALATAGILVAAGRLTSTDVALWLDLVAALLGLGGTGLAALHTPTPIHPDHTGPWTRDGGDR